MKLARGQITVCYYFIELCLYIFQREQKYKHDKNIDLSFDIILRQTVFTSATFYCMLKKEMLSLINNSQLGIFTAHNKNEFLRE